MQFDRILGFINQGKEQGAKLVAGKNAIQREPFIFYRRLNWINLLNIKLG